MSLGKNWKECMQVSRRAAEIGKREVLVNKRKEGKQLHIRKGRDTVYLPIIMGVNFIYKEPGIISN